MLNYLGIGPNYALCMDENERITAPFSGLLREPQRSSNGTIFGLNRRNRASLREFSPQEDASIVPTSDISSSERKIWIVTTASMPWMTGTSINPLMRAVYLQKDRAPGKVTLVIPWLEREDQLKLFPKNLIFDNQEQQEQYIREWLAKNPKLASEAQTLGLVFYPSRFHASFCSIFSMGDITDVIESDPDDVCILEEPEHLNWFRPTGTSSWFDKFSHVVGIMHTNYLMYSRGESMGFVKEFVIRYMSVMMCRAYCHKIIKLSGVLQEYAPEKETVCNVHGVREQFLEIGDNATESSFSKGAYFIGKMLWGKGYDKMISLLLRSKRLRGTGLKMDLFGSGPDKPQITSQFAKKKLPVTFHPATDHAQLTNYKVFVNPSTSEVLCTTTAEALAMGKFVVIPDHPSNVFFKDFQNCLMYRNKDEFCVNLSWAMTHTPEPLSASDRHKLTWEAATERLMVAAQITEGDQRAFKNKLDTWCANVHDTLGKGKRGDIIRFIAGGGRVAGQTAYMRQMAEQDQEQEQAQQDQVQPTAMSTA